MKNSRFLKATVVATVLTLGAIPIFAAEVAKEVVVQPESTVGEKFDDTAITTQVKMSLLYFLAIF